MSADIEKQVTEIIVKQLEVSPEQVKPTASFTDDLKADSLAVVELVLAFEEAFKIEIPDEDTEQIKTVGDAINYIKSPPFTRNTAPVMYAASGPHRNATGPATSSAAPIRPAGIWARSSVFCASGRWAAVMSVSM